MQSHEAPPDLPLPAAAPLALSLELAEERHLQLAPPHDGLHLPGHRLQQLARLRQEGGGRVRRRVGASSGGATRARRAAPALLLSRFALRLEAAGGGRAGRLTCAEFGLPCSSAMRPTAYGSMECTCTMVGDQQSAACSAYSTYSAAPAGAAAPPL